MGSEWTVPLTAGAARVVQFKGAFVNLGLAYVRYLEHPAGTADSELRLSATYVRR